MYGNSTAGNGNGNGASAQDSSGAGGAGGGGVGTAAGGGGDWMETIVGGFMGVRVRKGAAPVKKKEDGKMHYAYEVHAVCATKIYHIIIV